MWTFKVAGIKTCQTNDLRAMCLSLNPQANHGLFILGPPTTINWVGVNQTLQEKPCISGEIRTRKWTVKILDQGIDASLRPLRHLYILYIY